MIVIDTSAVLELLLNTPIGVRNAGRIFNEERHAPHLIDVELANSLRRIARSGKLGPVSVDEVLNEFRRFAIERHAHTDFLERIWQLRDSVSAYDAAYIALAEALGAPLLTCDARLSRAHGHFADITLLT